MAESKKPRPVTGRCCGCQEADAVVLVPELGVVCESCAEVLDIVFETEIERVKEATRTVLAVIESLA